MANFTLTAGSDTVVGVAVDDTVYVIAATLNVDLLSIIPA